MTTADTRRDSVAHTISTDSYLRERLEPQLQDPCYVHHADLLTFLKQAIPRQAEAVLDYGCGGSPYRSLFHTHKYVRADYVDVEGIDLKIAEDATLDCTDGEFDVVLSTQVLEHVRNPQSYLQQAWRVMRPGGRLILTTHGIWEDHGCPYDFRRWTADGLRYEISQSGFEIESMMKLTTGPRGVIFLFARILSYIRIKKQLDVGLVFWLLGKSPFASTRIRNAWLDSVYGMCCVVPDSDPGHGIYIALGCVAVKPGP